MKALISKASERLEKRTEREINTLEDLIVIQKEYGNQLIVEYNDRTGYLDIIVYDDYMESEWEDLL